jgi:hypothetical protein
VTSSAELRLVLTPCPLCGEDEAEPVAVGNDLAHETTRDSFLAVCCRHCGLVYLNPRPSPEERLRLYPPEYFSAGRARRWPTHAVARRAVRHCRALPPDARLLEVGLGPVLHLDALRQAAPRTWTLEAVTPHGSLARAARSAGFVVYEGGTDALEGVQRAYDAVLLLHALEHCASPVEALSSLRRLLRPGGRVVILTPNPDSMVGRLYRGRHWAGYDFPRHACLFGPGSMRRLAAATGLVVERLGTARDPQTWSRSAAGLLRDWDAPPWLARRAQPGALLLGGISSLAERAALLRARGARLEVVLHKLEERDR